MAPTSKQIAPGAYQALQEALAVVVWNLRPFETFLRTALRDHPELLVGLNFGDLKRNTVSLLVSRLVEGEARYQQTTLELMLEIAGMERFPNLEQQPDAAVRVATAKAAVAELRRWTDRYSALVAERESVETEQRTDADKVASRSQITADLSRLKDEFLELHVMSDHQERGRVFQRFLDKLFVVFDLEPRLEYKLPHEQLDGSLTFDTDDYVLEARWRKEPVSREAADAFAG
jgi:hypothetical protein